MEFLCFMLFCFYFFSSSVANDTMTPNRTLRDQGETLVSEDKSFELGFFSPWNSSNRYIGVWFKKISEQTVVWVANKNSPLINSLGVLIITSSGNILIQDSRSGLTLWSSNTYAVSPVLQLLNSGNLVVKDGRIDDNSGNYVWQSFDYPCDTLLPGMKLGSNLVTGWDWYLTSWKSLQDPSSGEFTNRIDHKGLPQAVLRRGTMVQYRSGPWDGVRFGGGPQMMDTGVFKPIFIFNSTHVYYTFEQDNFTTSRFVLNQSGFLQHMVWNHRDGEWRVIVTLNGNECDNTYARCGPYGICKLADNTACECPLGYTPKSLQDWNAQQTSAGCVARKPLNCSAGEGFRKFTGLKLPDASYLNRTVSPMECKKACLSNCSCVAYAETDVSDCVVWFGELLDLRLYNQGGHDLYIRMAASELDSENNKMRTIVLLLMMVISLVLLLGFVSWFIIWKRTAERRDGVVDNLHQDHSSEDIGEKDLELPLFDLVAIKAATNSFSLANKIGQGGFGIVYKGELSTGQEIAVKRLSEDSGQGLEEFKNEVTLIAKLQHRNLVGLLGCCIHGEERMLIYEYMPNKSLDKFIFNQTRGTSLSWQKRLDIIVGIARGLVYLHRDSRLRIIHRDLKASNILLDIEMIPKISDFGLARTFRYDQTHANTKRVIGTYGYMSPEYAIDGLFSVKSDVFSFGVLVLEIVNGKKNRGFCHPDHDLNLLGHAWKLWNEGRPLELVDVFMEGPIPNTEVLRCIQMGLLCVQLRPEDRPSMSWVLLMLDSENPMLPQPKQPGFYTERYIAQKDLSSSRKQLLTPNEVTLTMLQGR